MSEIEKTEQEKNDFANLLVAACARTWDNDEELLASGIGIIQRVAASLAMVRNPDLMMTDSEAYIVSEPVPPGKRHGYEPKRETWMGFSRIFENLWSGSRHALVGPSQIDQYGQANISALGDYQKPKVQMLGVRGFPGNSISHANSFFVPSHSTRSFVAGEVDTVCSIGYNKQRLPRGYSFADIHICSIITNLCVMDFEPESKQMRVVSLHPGVTLEQVKENTSFDLAVKNDLAVTPAASKEDVAIIESIDPNNLRLLVV